MDKKSNLGYKNRSKMLYIFRDKIEMYPLSKLRLRENDFVKNKVINQIPKLIDFHLRSADRRPFWR